MCVWSYWHLVKPGETISFTDGFGDTLEGAIPGEGELVVKMVNRNRVTATATVVVAFGLFCKAWVMFGFGDPDASLTYLLFSESGIAWCYVASGFLTLGAAWKSWRGKPFWAAAVSAVVFMLSLSAIGLLVGLYVLEPSDPSSREFLASSATVLGIDSLISLIPGFIACFAQLYRRPPAE